MPPPPPAAFPRSAKPPETVVVSGGPDATPLVRFLLASPKSGSVCSPVAGGGDPAPPAELLPLSPRFLPSDIRLPSVAGTSGDARVHATGKPQEKRDSEREEDTDCQVYLLQFESCPFCRKVRACLDFLKIPYTIVEVEPLLKKELKPFGYSKVPLLVIARQAPVAAPPEAALVSAAAAQILARWAEEDATKKPEARRLFALADSKAIVHALVEHQRKQPNARPDAQPRRQREVEWLIWTDQVLVQLIVMNVYRTMQESLETFSYLLTHPSFSYLQQLSGRWTGSVVMRLVARQRKKRYAVDDVRRALYDTLDDFRRSFEESETPSLFFGGTQPDEVDLAVFGILNSTEGCTVEKDILQHSSIGPWLKRMRQAVGPSTAFNHIPRGPSPSASSPFS